MTDQTKSTSAGESGPEKKAKPLKAFAKLGTTLAAIAAATGTTVLPIGEVPVNFTEQMWQAARFAITSPTLVTGNSLATINIRLIRAGVSQGNVASLLLAGNLAAETPVAIPLTGSLVPQAGDLLEFQYVQTSTGLALVAGTKVDAEIE